jgi:hypothetical protein
MKKNSKTKNFTGHIVRGQKKVDWEVISPLVKK